MDHNNTLASLYNSRTDSDAVYPGTASTEDVTPAELRIATQEDIDRLVDQFKSLDIPKMSPDMFLFYLTQSRNAWFLELGNVGIAFFTEIVPNHSANFHFYFWDYRIRDTGREHVIKHVNERACQLFNLVRITAVTPAQPVREFLQASGFKVEGKHPKSVLRNGKFVPSYTLGFFPEEEHGDRS